VPLEQLEVPLAMLVEQVLPQLPQLLGSFCSLTQAPEQGEVPPLQVNPHTPPRQTGVALATPVVHAVAVPH
jgi:hypothetical protein